jgi:hypothetical protein
MSGTKEEEVVGGWRRMHNEFHHLYTSSNTVWVVKSKRMRWAGHVTQVGR